MQPRPRSRSAPEPSRSGSVPCRSPNRPPRARARSPATGSEPMFTTAPAPATYNGVRVSCRPRSTPVVASTASMAGNPSSDHRRKVMPKPATSGAAPNASMSTGASGQQIGQHGYPDDHREVQSGDPEGQRVLGPAGPQRPGDRSGRAVGQEHRKARRRCQESPTRCRPRPAAAIPRWPTIAASTSRKTGSASSAPRAGTASRRICAFSPGSALPLRLIPCRRSAGSPAPTGRRPPRWSTSSTPTPASTGGRARSCRRASRCPPAAPHR